MNALPWILTLLTFVGLLIAYPRRMITLCVGVFVFSLTAFLSLQAFEGNAADLRQKKIEMISATIGYSEDACSTEYPLFLVIENGTDERVDNVSFLVKGYRAGRSSPVFKTDYAGFKSDLIIGPGERAASCWKVPDVAYGVPQMVAQQNPPHSLNWKTEKLRPTFGDNKISMTETQLNR